MEEFYTCKFIQNRLNIVQEVFIYTLYKQVNNMLENSVRIIDNLKAVRDFLKTNLTYSFRI